MLAVKGDLYRGAWLGDGLLVIDVVMVGAGFREYVGEELDAISLTVHPITAMIAARMRPPTTPPTT